LVDLGSENQASKFGRCQCGFVGSLCLWFYCEGNMKGSIRAFVGFMLVFGAVGALDHDPSASVFTATMVALAGLAVMYSGVRAMTGVK
jgi:hypothetical protein